MLTPRSTAFHRRPEPSHRAGEALRPSPTLYLYSSSWSSQRRSRAPSVPASPAQLSRPSRLPSARRGSRMACLSSCFQRLDTDDDYRGDAPVGLVFEESMLLHKGRWDHPECPERAVVLNAKLAAEGLDKRCVALTPRQATDEELLRCHEADHVRKVTSVSAQLAAQPDRKAYADANFDSVYFSEGTAKAARFAAGCTVQAVRSVLNGEVRRAMAVVRPPGHHAVCERAMGFCIFNNVAVAVRDALAMPGVERVAVVDWDVHHGNGIQDILYDEPRALFLSLHRYGRGFYPGTGPIREAGGGAGLGFNVNVPWTNDSKADADYQAAFSLVVEPVLRDFKPDLIIVAAGFDASADDLIGDCDLLPEVYGWMTERLLQFAGGRVVLSLEGGYNTSMTADCAAACVRTLLEGRAAEHPWLRLGPTEGTHDDLKKVYLFQRRFWRLRCPSDQDWCCGAEQSEEQWAERLEAEWAHEWETFLSVRQAAAEAEAAKAAPSTSGKTMEEPFTAMVTTSAVRAVELGDSPAAALERVAAAAVARAAASAAASATVPAAAAATAATASAASAPAPAETPTQLAAVAAAISSGAAVADDVAAVAASGDAAAATASSDAATVTASPITSTTAATADAVELLVEAFCAAAVIAPSGGEPAGAAASKGEPALAASEGKPAEPASRGEPVEPAAPGLGGGDKAADGSGGQQLAPDQLQRGSL